MLFNKAHPKSRFVYAITKGRFVGQLFVYIESLKSNHYFLSLPQMEIRTVPSDKFTLGLKEKIVDIVEKLPNNIYNVCRAQYLKDKKKLNVPIINNK